MKNLVSIIVALIVGGLILFVVDPKIVNWILSEIPASADEWKGLIKIVVWVIVLGLTGAFTFFITVASGIITRFLLK